MSKKCKECEKQLEERKDTFEWLNFDTDKIETLCLECRKKKD